jgi:cytochrome c-type biogenesis protein CcmH/NrfG
MAAYDDALLGQAHADHQVPPASALLTDTHHLVEEISKIHRLCRLQRGPLLVAVTTGNGFCAVEWLAVGAESQATSRQARQRQQ